MIARTVCTAFFILLFSFSAAHGRPGSDEKARAFSASIKAETTGDFKRAIQIMNDFSRGSETDYLVTIRLGWLHYSAGEYAQSEKHYRDAIRLSDNSVEALLGVTLPCAAQGKWDLVQDAYKTILGKDKQNYTANLRLGQIYLNQGNYLLARKYLDILAGNYPGDYETNLSLGWTYYGLGSKGKAREAFINAMSVYPADTSAVKGLGLTR
jgi:tetratricopeptide (TPR) repeat protein